MNPHRIPIPRLEALVAALLEAAGTPSDLASETAGALVDAEARGRSSHGVALLEPYLARIRTGAVDPTALPVVETDLGALLVLDGRHGLGQPAAHRATTLAIERARRHGVALVTVRRAFHFGEAGRYARLAVSAGCLGVAMSNTPPLLSADGASGRTAGNNPVAVGAPRPGSADFVIDIAMSSVSMNRVRAAAASGSPLSADWAVDDEGRPTTDAAAAIRGALRPFGGHKGLGLALAVELFTGVLAGGALGDAVHGLHAAPELPYDCSLAFIVVDLARIMGAANAADRVETVVARVGARAPGERSERARARAESEGVVLDGARWELLRNAGAALGIEIGWTDAEADAKTGGLTWTRRA